MQQPRAEDLLCYSKAISTQNDQSVCLQTIRKYLALIQHFVSMNLSVSQKLQIRFWPHLGRKNLQLEQEEICPQPQNTLIAEPRTDLWSLSPKSNNRCHALCFAQDRLYKSPNCRNAKVVYIFGIEKIVYMTAILVSTDLPGL